MTGMAERITRKLEDALAPQRLSVIDESHQHQGHGGWREGGQTHFRVDIVSQAFAGKSRLERHRLVNAALAEELADGVHALAIVARGPGEG
jgi:BolA protein